MEYQKFGAITSSQDSQEIANTIKGLVLSLSSIIILVAQQFFHIGLTAGDVTSFATEISIAVGAVWTVYGLVLKVLAWKFKQPTV